jgi:hypothetical protein
LRQSAHNQAPADHVVQTGSADLSAAGHVVQRGIIKCMDLAGYVVQPGSADLSPARHVVQRGIMKCIDPASHVV